MAASDRPNRIFDAVKAAVTQTGVLAGKTRRAPDCTVLDDAVATQDTVTQLIGAIGRVARDVPGAGEVITAHCCAHGYTDGQWRIAPKVAGDRVISTVDPEARHGHKTVHRRQDGLNAHIAIEPDTEIITDCELTRASGPDNPEAGVGPRLLADEDTPARVLADSAYGTGAARAVLADVGHVAVTKPLPLRAPVPGGSGSDFKSAPTNAARHPAPGGH